MQFYTNVIRYGNQLLYRGFENGRRVQTKIKYKPTLFVSTNKQSEWKTIDGELAAPVIFDTMSDAKSWIDENKDVSNRNIFGSTKYHYNFINENFPLNIEFDMSLINITSIDIEVASDDGFPSPVHANKEVTAICIKNLNDDTYRVWACGGWSAKDSIVFKDYPDVKIDYHECANEKELLISFINYWQSNYPDAITGWNSDYFDMAYLANRIMKILNESYLNRLSPWNRVEMYEKEFNGKKHPVANISGIPSLDFMKVFQKFGYSYGPQESYKLDHIANVVLGKEKISYDEYDSLHTLYLMNHQLFIDYNIVDVILVNEMIKATGLIELALTIAYKAGVNYEDTFGTTSVWDSIIHRNLWAENKVVPFAKPKIKMPYPGGYVKAPHVGMHEYVASFDLKSLYPSIIMQWNMSPETIIEGMTASHDTSTVLNNPSIVDHKGLSVSANGQYFKTDKIGILPQIIDGLYSERSSIKKEMLKLKQQSESDGNEDLSKEIGILDNRQMAVKILLNSLYGALGNKYFRFFNQQIAEAITSSGQLVIQWSEKTINGYLNKILGTKNSDYVIAIDTDSCYINLSKLVDKVNPKNPIDFIDAVCKEKLEPVLEKSYGNLFQIMGGTSNRMIMEREVLADRAIWTAKKRYILNVYDNEGVRYKEPKLKIMGIEAIKSSTPHVCRDALKSIFKTIMTKGETEVQSEIAEFKTKFFSLEADKVAFPRGVSDVDKYMKGNTYRPKTPINSRAAILYNARVDELGLKNKYQQIKNGDKIKFVYLKKPNPISENVIAFPEYLPKELQLTKYIDYETQFQKTFGNVIEPILEKIGWSLEEKGSLDDFFC